MIRRHVLAWRIWLGVVVLMGGLSVTCRAAEEDSYYTGPQVYNSRPNPKNESDAGHLGPTGINARFYPGVVLKVETVSPDTPAAGLIEKGDVILGVNGTALKGKNPYVVLGDAVTKAQAGDGKLTYDLQRGDKTMQVTVEIAKLGTYGQDWPLDCPKSKKIIERASAWYSDFLSKQKSHDVEGGLAALFLLSTGDDTRLPIVKAYFQQFITKAPGEFDNTWYNGYNGIACAEYYLRTGDKDVLPLLQHYCDDARDRQKFGVGWTHWSNGINPGYVASGLMNPAGAQVLTTLLLCKQCPVNVDDKTLMGALKYFYRFAGHGTVPYGDHRSEGGLGSNGKDGMIAASMQAASCASGDTSIYTAARDDLSMATIQSYPCLSVGHADEGRGDGIWRGLAAAYMKDKRPAAYRGMMDRLTWWFDLSQYADGAMGVATNQRFNDTGSGAGVMLAYTAPLKTLCITGAPRSKFAKPFTLPADLWGRPADLAFFDIDPNPKYLKYGPAEPVHVPFYALGSAYSKSQVAEGTVSHDQMLRNVYHDQYMIRAQAAKALRQTGHLDDLENLLSDPDPRVRRAALDGIIDWRYWFDMGKDPIKTDQYTPGMIEKITKMLRDPDEAIYVVDGALWAMHNMPAKVINDNLDAILPWTTSDEWWLRESSFFALQGLAKDPQLYQKVLPRLLQMMIDEYHTMPRERMTGEFNRVCKAFKPDSAIFQQIVAGFQKAVEDSTVKQEPYTREGTYNVLLSVNQCLALEPKSAVAVTRLLADRLPEMDTGNLLSLIGATDDLSNGGRKGIYSLRQKLDAAQSKELTDLLYNKFRPDFIRRMKTEKGANLAMIDTILALTQLEKEVAGWQPVGTPAPSERIWQYISFDATDKSDMMPPREKKRFRDIKMPDKFDGWYKPDYHPVDWQSGPAPIGVGTWPNHEKDAPTVRSDWGKGEFLLARCMFTVDDLDADLYRLNIVNNQGYRIYLNGKEIATYIWWNDTPQHRYRNMDDNQVALLHQGVNTLAIYANCEYPADMKPWRWKEPVHGVIDAYIEALKLKDIEQ